MYTKHFSQKKYSKGKYVAYLSMIMLQPTVGILDTACISQTLPPILVGSWEASCLLTTASPPWKVQIL